VFKKVFPSPFTIAILLSIVTFFIALIWGGNTPNDQITTKQSLDGYHLVFKNSDINDQNISWKSKNENMISYSGGSLNIPNSIPDKLIQLTILNTKNSYKSTFNLNLNHNSGQLNGIEIQNTSKSRATQLLDFWYSELWGKAGLAFAIQMMLMLLLGYVLALSKPINDLLNKITPLCSSNGKAAVYVTFFTVIVSLFNWGLGLIFGAVFARKVGEFAKQNGIQLNYPLIGAAGYTGLMVWHGGISGSSLVKVSEPGHLSSLINDSATLQALPDVIPFSMTVFSPMNITVTLMLLLLLPLTGWFLAKRTKTQAFEISGSSSTIHEELEIGYTGAERLDHSKVFAYLFSFFILSYILYLIYNSTNVFEFRFITPNFINFMLLGLALLFHGSIHKFLKSVDEAIKSVSGILIQFPIYFGIMGIMKHSGMIGNIADLFASISTSFSYPIYTFFSAGLVNIFVPSGGGQWYVQGPIVLQATVELGVSPAKSILALAYGDQITNMLQPFWALPLLGITGLKAKEILPYTLLFMLMGIVIFMLGLSIF